jgi:hypothetical protein
MHASQPPAPLGSRTVKAAEARLPSSAGKLDDCEERVRLLQMRCQDLEAIELRLSESCTEMKLQLAGQAQELGAKGDDVRSLQVRGWKGCCGSGSAVGLWRCCSSRLCAMLQGQLLTKKKLAGCRLRSHTP